MSSGTLDPRWKAVLVVALLFSLGAVAGAAGDRLWLGPRLTATPAAPLTREAMFDALGLDGDQVARVRSVLDSVEVEVSQALRQGPGALQAAAEDGRRRLEDALPADRRAPFRQWMEGHHARMMEMMGRDRMDSGGMMGRDRMGPGGMMGSEGPAEGGATGRR